MYLPAAPCILVLLLMSLLPTFTLAEPLVIKLWPDSIPGEVAGHGIEEEVRIANGTLHAFKVVDPELIVHLPPEEERNGTTILILPGGGYGTLALGHEGQAVQRWLNGLGVTTAILKYRLPSDSVMKDKSIAPLQDAQEAMRIIRRHAREWGIAPDRVGVVGFSAGGHLASSLSTHFDLAVGPQTQPPASARPDFAILVYPVITMSTDLGHTGSRKNLLGETPAAALADLFSTDKQVGTSTPPTFILHATDDTVVDYRNSLRYHEALLRMEVPAELHLYPTGGHGFALGREDTSTVGWPAACETWMRASGFIKTQ